MKISIKQLVGFIQSELNVNRDSKKLLYQTIYEAIKGGIVNGSIPKDSQLPPTRKLANELGVSRSTIVTVYDLLRLERLVESRGGAGFKVIYENYTRIFNEPKDELLEGELSEMAKSFYKNVHRVNILDPGQSAFRPGLPPVDLFPINTWKKLVNQFWQLVRARDLSYYPENGIESLRSTIADYLRLTRGIVCHKDQIMIVGGSLQSLYLIGSLLLNPGDSVLLENPTFPNVHSLFSGLRADITGVPVDPEGMNLDHLNDRVLKDAKLIHITPSSHYPLGMQMSYDRRKRICQLAAKNNLFIIENDYEHEVNGMQIGLKTLYAEDVNNRTFYLGTFNRILHPSVRLGYMVVPEKMVAPIRAIARHSHLMVSPSTQMVIDEFIQKDYLHMHVRKVKHVAQERKEIFEKHMSRIKSLALNESSANAPSLHNLYKLSNSIPDKKAIDQMSERNVTAHQLSKCFVSDKKEQGLIFGYSCTPHASIPAKIDEISKAMRN